MFGSKTTEVSGVHQATLERRYLRRIREINDKLRRLLDTHRNWDDADPRLRAHYTREEFWTQFIAYQYEERRSYIRKLRDVRRGIVRD